MPTVNKPILAFAALLFGSHAFALCCQPNAAAVVSAVNADTALLRTYNDELDKTIAELRSAVALSMAVNLEKERQASEIATMRRIMGLKTDLGTLLIRKKIVSTDAEIATLQGDFNTETEKELKKIGEIK